MFSTNGITANYSSCLEGKKAHIYHKTKHTPCNYMKTSAKSIKVFRKEVVNSKLISKRPSHRHSWCKFS